MYIRWPGHVCLHTCCVPELLHGSTVTPKYTHEVSQGCLWSHGLVCWYACHVPVPPYGGLGTSVNTCDTVSHGECCSLVCIHTVLWANTYLPCPSTALWWCTNACSLVCYARTSHNIMQWSGLTSSQALVQGLDMTVYASLFTCQLCPSTTRWQYVLTYSHPYCAPLGSGASALKTYIQETLHRLNRLCLGLYMYKQICIGT